MTLKVLLAKKTFYVDIILVVSIILIALINPYYAYSIGYLGGVINSKIHVLFIPVTFFLVILFFILICIFLIRTIHLYESKKNNITVIRFLLIIFSFCFSVIFCWTHPGEPYPIPFTNGLAHWAENNVDVTAMEEYLNNVIIDEDNIRGDGYITNQSDWPAAIRELKPKSVTITNVYDNDRKQIHFFWGGGFFGWGMVVGANVSETEVFNIDKYNEYKILFHPHGYVFCET